MFEKLRNYNKESIEVCRNCQGSWLIKKTLNIEITIVPYAGDEA
ncbi:MAG: hypothetical protein RR221_07585 [Alistipes sp.]